MRKKCLFYCVACTKTVLFLFLFKQTVKMYTSVSSEIKSITFYKTVTDES